MEQTQQERPLLAEMVRRSSVDWGVAPKYTEEYRRIRWPGNTGIGRPTWMATMRYQTRRKAEGTWNSSGPEWRKPDTSRGLYTDIRFCMAQNIPFKTVTYEYKPHNQMLYVKGVPVLKYELETGSLEDFTYSGVYDKVISFFLRSFNIDVKNVRGKLIWTSDTYGERPIDIYGIYNLKDPRIINECSTIISRPLNAEFNQRDQTLANRPGWRRDDTALHETEHPNLTPLQRQIRDAVEQEVIRLGDAFPRPGMNFTARVTPNSVETQNFVTDQIRDVLTRRNDRFEVINTTTEDDVRTGRMNVAIRVATPVEYMTLRTTITRNDVDWNTE